MGDAVKLARWRKSANLTQEELADKLGLTTVSVARYESGARMPGPGVMIALFEMSQGKVTPNDFYSLPDLQVDREAA